MFMDEMWDEEVDVVCVGAAVFGLASAIVAVDAGADVFVATSSTQHEDSRSSDRGWLRRVADEETDEYFSQLTMGLTPLHVESADSALPIRMVRDLSQVERVERRVESFFGARLDDWATRCLTSPYGVLHTRVAGRQLTPMRSAEGEAVEVKVVGEVKNAGEGGGPVLLDWLQGQADDRGIEVHTASPLQRIVFEEGDVTGVVLDTPDGPYAVRARHGVTVAPEDHGQGARRLVMPGADQVAQVGLVSKNASRFGRLELLVSAKKVARRSDTCHRVNRHLHHNLHEARQHRSEARRS